MQCMDVMENIVCLSGHKTLSLITYWDNYANGL